MTKRINLTNKITVNSTMPHNLIIQCDEPAQLKQQILDDSEKAQAMESIQLILAQTGMNKEQILEHFAKQKEKAEKWDELKKHNCNGAALEHALNTIQENKQLKEELYSSRTFLADSQKHCDDLDNKHEEYRKYQKELIDSLEGKAHGLKQKLEKTKEFVTNQLSMVENTLKHPDWILDEGELKGIKRTSKEVLKILDSQEKE